eukprot:scaffold307547_cov19-Prasinocladus_malaysianus.AAC.1
MQWEAKTNLQFHQQAIASLKISSEPFPLNGIVWILCAYCGMPDTGANLSQEHLGIFMLPASNSMARLDPFDLRLEILVLSSTNAHPYLPWAIIAEKQVPYSKDRLSRLQGVGYAKIISVRELTDPSRGYLSAESMSIKIQVRLASSKASVKLALDCLSGVSSESHGSNSLSWDPAYGTQVRENATDCINPRFELLDQLTKHHNFVIASETPSTDGYCDGINVVGSVQVRTPNFKPLNNLLPQQSRPFGSDLHTVYYSLIARHWHLRIGLNA